MPLSWLIPKCDLFFSRLLWSRGQEWWKQAQIENQIFFPIHIGGDAVFNGLSESGIKSSDGATWNRKIVKIKNDKKWRKIFLQKKRSNCHQYFKSCRSILDPNETFLETKMISEKSSTNPISLSQFWEPSVFCDRDPKEYPNIKKTIYFSLVIFF